MTQLPDKTELGLLPRLIAAGWFAGSGEDPSAVLQYRPMIPNGCERALDVELEEPLAIVE